MGQDVRQDWAIPLPAMHASMSLLDTEWTQVEVVVNCKLVASITAYSIIAFCGWFRGSEVFLTDLHRLRKYFHDLHVVGNANHAIIPLLGKFKGELSARYHLAPMATETSSGLRPKLWVARLIEVRERAGRVQGPAFCDVHGEIARALVYEEAIITWLVSIQERFPEIIGKDVNLMEEFGISRSFRRGSTSTARARGVEDKHVDLINRWRKFEQARGRHPALAMRDHYSDIEILIPELVKYSQAL
jgi:hypothetical protein